MGKFFRIIIHYLLISFSLISFLLANPQFDHITIEDGLSQNKITCIIRDHNGFLWIGTQNGLNRYDGNRIKVYRHLPDNPNSLSDNQVQSLHIDKLGILWIATFGGGLNKFQKETERFTHYRYDPDNPHSLSDDFLLSLYEERAGFLWIGTNGGGINKFDKKESFTAFKNEPDNPNSLSHNIVRAFYEDTSGILWIGTDGGGLNKLDGKKKEFTHYQHDPNNPESLSHNFVLSITEDQSGFLWIGTFGGGLNKFDRDREVFTAYQYDPHISNSLSHNTIQAMYKSPIEKNIIWIATEGGLNKFDTKNGTFISFQHELDNPGSLSDNFLLSVYEDKTGLVWIGTESKGLNKYNREKEKIKHFKKELDSPNSLSHNNVISFWEDKSGILWIGTDGGGLNKFERNTEKFTHYKHDSNNPNTLSHNIVYSIVEDRSGKLWIGTMEGLNRFDPETNKFTIYKHDPANSNSLSYNLVFSLYLDQSDNLWVGTIGGGLNQLMPSHDNEYSPSFIHYQYEPANPFSLNNNSIMIIYEDRPGTFWIGTMGGGLNKFDRKTKKFTHYQREADNPNSLSHNLVAVIHEDKSGILWIGTDGGGLNKFNPETESFIHYREKDGLANDAVYGILEDSKGHLWLCTKNGISKFDPLATDRNGKALPAAFRNYDNNDGFQNSELLYLAYKSRSGEMFLGGINGFDVFYPDSLKKNWRVPAIVLTDFKVHGETFELDSSITNTKEILLSYKENFFYFDFASLDFMAPHKNQYAYMLEGLDEDWIYCDNRHFANYTNVDPGEYIFKVKGSNNDGVWNEEGASVKIIITPPFWKRSWFLIVTGLLLLSGFVTLVRFIFTRRLQQRLRALEQQRVMEKERSRISSDMHDEVGASLTHIAITSELLKKSLSGSGENEVSRYIEDISGTAREVIDSIGEIIWAINPRNDSLDNLIAYIRQYAGKMFELTPIRCRYDFPENSPQQTLSAEVRRNIFLVVKEALNNILKHAGAEEVQLKIDIQRNNLEIGIEDNGKGFCDQDISRFGNGLKNMKQRMEDIRGTFDIHSRPGKGTRIRIKVNLRF